MEPFVNATPGRYLCVGLPIDIDEPAGASAANNGRRAPWLPQALADLWAEQAASVYRTYLRYAGPGDIFVRSIGEHFIDAEAYLATTGADSHDLACELARIVFAETGIPIEVGAGDNLFLAKVARDRASQSSSKVALLDAASFRRDYWLHRPIADLWGFGPETARRLEQLGIYDLAGVAGESEEALYREFGAEAEFLIDHAWGMEPCTLRQVLRCKAAGSSVSKATLMPSRCTGYQMERTICGMTRELCEDLALDGLAATSVTLHLGYPAVCGPAGPHGRYSDDPAERIAAASARASERTRALPGYVCESRCFARPIAAAEPIAAAVNRLYEKANVAGLEPWRVSVTLRDLVPSSTPSRSEPMLRLLEARVARRGSHVARNHAGRGRQFVLLPAYRGYSDMVAKIALDEEAA